MNRYEEYKKVDIPWINVIPKHWECLKINSVFEERIEKVSDRDYEALSVTKKGIFNQLENVAKTKDNDNRKKVCIDDFVINSRSDRKGSSGLSKLEGSVSLINIVLKIKYGNVEYLKHLLKSIPFQEEFYRNGKGIVADLWTTSFKSMKNIILPFPDIKEQKQIADYLDWKINEIDKLIHIEKEKIKEFNKMKEIFLNQYINDYSEGTLIKIKYFSKLYGRIGWQGLNSSEYSSDGILLITGTDFNEGGINFSKCVRVPLFRWEQNKNIQIQNGDLLITKDGTIGKLAIVNELYEKATLNSGVMKIEFEDNNLINKGYLYYVLKSNIFKNWFNNLGVGFSTIQHLYQKDFYNFSFKYPSIDMQLQITKKIKNMENLYDEKIRIINKKIDLLNKLKESLISEVVTGQIDVRDVVIPEYDKVNVVEEDIEEMESE